MAVWVGKMACGVANGLLLPVMGGGWWEEEAAALTFFLLGRWKNSSIYVCGIL